MLCLAKRSGRSVKGVWKPTKGVCPDGYKRKTDKRKCFVFLRFVGFLLPLVCTQSARNGNRTRTAITGQGILSPSCLPIPPSGRFALQRYNKKWKVKSEKWKIIACRCFYIYCQAKKVALRSFALVPEHSRSARKSCDNPAEPWAEGSTSLAIHCRNPVPTKSELWTYKSRAACIKIIFKPWKYIIKAWK